MAITKFITLLTLLAGARALQNMKCQDGPYPYCVHVQSDSPKSGGKWPTAIFLPGSGARGSLGNADQLALYDGHGKMIGQYYWGQKGQAQMLAAEEFLTIIPIAPDGSRHFDPDKVLAILNEVKSNYNVDENKVTCSGYSMGSRGSWRFGVFHPEVLAGLAPSAGAAEDVNAGTLQQEAAPATFPLLKNVVNLGIRAFAGSADTTAGTSEEQRTQAQIVSLGGKKSSLTILQGADHSAMSTKPWTDTDLLSWLLKQTRSGSSSAISSTGTTSSKTHKPTPTKSKGKSKSTSTSTPKAVSKKVAEPQDTEEEDCEEEEEGDDVDEEDCEEEEDPTEDDCEDEDDSSSSSQNVDKRDIVPSATRQQHARNTSFWRRQRASAPAVARHRRDWHSGRMVHAIKRKI